MKTYVCKICNHIAFNEAPDRCPVCMSPNEDFNLNPDAIKKPKDRNNLLDSEKKHLPTLVVVKQCGLIPGGGCTDVHVKVGEIEHVMQKDHFITYIDFYHDQKFLARTHLTPEKLHPAAALHLNVNSGTILAIENCNLHGNWMTEVNL